MLQRLGTISFQGEISGYFTDLVTYGRLRTNIGSLSTDIKFSSDKEKNQYPIQVPWQHPILNLEN